MTTNAPLQDSGNQNGLQAIVVDPASPDQASKQHKRTYQACEPCRNRKVRCDLGSVDAPSDPPCLRCRREKKQCYFTETRRKRKVGEPGAPELRDFGSDMRRDEHFANGLVSRPEHLENMGVYTKVQMMHHPGQPGNAPGISQQPQIRVQGNGDEVRNDEAAELFQQPIHQPGDALRLLVDAASRTESMASKHPEIHQVPLKQETEAQPSNIDPAIMKISSHDPPDQETLRQQALQTWARLRYVRAGWFTPLEGMAYLEYFSEYLSSLTPIPTPDFSKPESHIKLLTEEPMLTVTLLTIASRYQKLPGAGGASRSIYIHSMLWQECQAMITRMFWGQEHFGGSFGLASGYRADTGEPIKRGLRGLGTVEALLLLSDWHPRSMHFPPAAGNDDILAPLQSEWEEANHVMQSRNPHQGWTEPAMRSDRMSWSLVGAAYNLALELGVFDSMPELGYFQPGYKTRAYDAARADRIGRLVHIYVSQTSGRLGYPNMLPQRNMDHDMDHEFFRMKLEPEPGEDEDDPEYVSEQMQRALCGLTGIMRRVNNEIFRSKNQTLELIQSNKYTGVLESFWPALKEWLGCVEQIKLPRLARTVIMMEYEYSRTYINSLALQAQIEQYAELQNRDPSAVNGENNALFSQRLVDISKQNAPYIAEVVDSTRNLLRHVVEGLQPGGGLRHCPVRTNFRILSGAMFLLKTFALGSKEADIQQSITLLNKTVTALRATVVDDCHLCLRIADLLASLIQWISGKFVRVPINSRPGHSKRHRASLSSNPVPARPGMEGNPESPVLGKPPTSSDIHHGPGNINGTDLPFVPPLINPNDPNVVIMPPPDYMHPFPENPYVQHASPRGGNPAIVPNGYKPGVFQGQPAQATRSPTVGNAGVHPPMSFSPTPQNQQPFSPRSTGSGSGAGSYDWYAMDMGPLLHSSNGPIQPGMAANSVPWGNMLAPDIGDTLEMLGQLGSDGTGFDDGMGTWAAV